MSGSLRLAPVRRLVGRADELETLRESWRVGGAVWLVEGPAGVGKSRLIRELASGVVSSGGIVVEGRAIAGTAAAPLRPISEALIGAARLGLEPDPSLDPYVPILGSFVPDWNDGRIASGSGGPALLLLGEALLRLAATWARDRTTLIVIEDLHWADPETLAVLDFVADHLAEQPVMFVASVRDTELTAGVRFANDIAARRVANVMSLRPLSPAEVIELATECLAGAAPPAEITDALASRSEGIPFLVEELIATALDSGWESVAGAVPGSVVASIGLRLDQLDPDCRRLLIAGAMLGRQFDWTLDARALDLDEETAARLLRDAVRGQLLDVDGSSFRFRHAMTRDAVLCVASPSERSMLARRVLTALEESGLDGDRLLVAAELAESTDQPAQASAHFAQAARRALRSGALASAEQFASRARAMAPEEHASTLDDLLLEIAVDAGDAARARKLARTLVTRPADRAVQAARHLLLARAELDAGQWVAARQAAEAAAHLVPADEALLAQIDGLVAEAAMGQDDVAVADERARRALALAGPTGQQAVECGALEVIGRAIRGRDVGAAEREFQRAYDVAEAAGLELWRVRALHELGTIDLFDTLRLDRLHRARHDALRLGAFATVAMVDLQLAATHLERGEVDEALATARTCQELSTRLGLSTRAMSHMIEGMAFARLGDEQAMDAALERGRALEEDADYVEASVWGNAVAMLHLVRGDVAAAVQALDRGMDVIRRRPAAVLPYPGLWALVRTIIDDGGAEARAEVAALAFDTPVSRRTLAVARAVALGRRGDPTAAARFAAADDALGAGVGGFRQQLARLLIAPIAHADGWGEPDAWLRAALASFESKGLQMLSGRARRALRSIGAPVPRRSSIAVSTVPEPLARLGVTGREVDVLVLVAAGATNREVADRLVISTRTVDKHVERLLQKTGVQRAGLRNVAQEAGLAVAGGESFAPPLRT